MKMYKITLMDYNTPSCVSWTTEFFTDDIEKFKKDWFELESDEERKKRFLDSLGGKIVTDYFSKSEELNIVQEDRKAKILFQKKYDYPMMGSYNLENGYGWESVIFADRSTFWVRGIRFKGKYFLVGKYRLVGVCKPKSVFDGEHLQLRDVEPYGNCVVKARHKSMVKYDENGVSLYDVTDFSNFKDDMLAFICYIPMKMFGTRKELEYFVREAPVEGLFGYLMRDIPGDAG